MLTHFGIYWVLDAGERYLYREFINVLKPDLPPFEEYLNHVFTEKKTASIGGKEVLLSKLRDKIFDPEQESNQQLTEHLLPCVNVIAKTLIKETTDEKKAIHLYFTINGPEKTIYSNDCASSAQRKALRRVPANNNMCESTLGSPTY